MDVLVYCKDCQSRNSWVRNPARDYKDINGKPIEYGYKCAVCGHTTLVPADKSDVTPVTELGVYTFDKEGTMSGKSSKTQVITFRLPNEVFNTISKRLLSSTNSSSSVPDYCRRAALLRIYAKHKGGRRLKELQICTCLQCGYQWNCKITEPPKRCASCCTHNWNKPKMRNQGRPMKCFGDTKLTGAGDESMKIDEDGPHPSPLPAIEGLRK